MQKKKSPEPVHQKINLRLGWNNCFGDSVKNYLVVKYRLKYKYKSLGIIVDWCLENFKHLVRKS